MCFIFTNSWICHTNTKYLMRINRKTNALVHSKNLTFAHHVGSSLIGNRSQKMINPMTIRKVLNKFKTNQHYQLVAVCD